MLLRLKATELTCKMNSSSSMCQCEKHLALAEIGFYNSKVPVTLSNVSTHVHSKTLFLIKVHLGENLFGSMRPRDLKVRLATMWLFLVLFFFLFLLLVVVVVDVPNSNIYSRKKNKPSNTHPIFHRSSHARWMPVSPAPPVLKGRHWRWNGQTVGGNAGIQGSQGLWNIV